MPIILGKESLYLTEIVAKLRVARLVLKLEESHINETRLSLSII